MLAPGVLLAPGAAGSTGITLCGCAAAALLQAAGVSLHLLLGAQKEGLELGTWRLQRVGAGLGLFGALCVLAALPGITASSPLMSM